MLGNLSPADIESLVEQTTMIIEHAERTGGKPLLDMIELLLVHRRKQNMDLRSSLMGQMRMAGLMNAANSNRRTPLRAVPHDLKRVVANYANTPKP